MSDDGVSRFLGKVTQGDCLELMRELPDNYVDSVITDPPYEIGFMGKSWDNSGISFNTEVWAECLRVAKPGAFLLAFGGTRTWHRIACAIEDAGWVLRDSVVFWTYGSGFPKSKSLREVGDEWAGYGTALKPSHEPIMVFMKPCDGTFAQNAEKWGIAGLNIDGGRIALPSGSWLAERGEAWCKSGNGSANNELQAIAGNERNGVYTDDKGRWPANTILSCACDGEHAEDCPVRIMDEQSGVSKSKGAFPKIAKKKTYNNSSYDIYPAVNEQRVTLNDSGGASRFFYCAKPSRAEKEAGLDGFEKNDCISYTEAAICPVRDNRKTIKVTNNHATVKPVNLMRYLCKLTATPTGGIVLDPFTGSGTTGIAAILEGREFIGFELSEEYVDIANARIAYHKNLNDEKSEVRETQLTLI